MFVKNIWAVWLIGFCLKLHNVAVEINICMETKNNYYFFTGNMCADSPVQFYPGWVLKGFSAHCLPRRVTYTVLCTFCEYDTTVW